MFVLGMTREESTAAAVGMGVLTSCALLLIYRPRRTELEGMPHRVPWIAVLVALAWVFLVGGLPMLFPGPVEEVTLTVGSLWFTCAFAVSEIGIPAAAYLIPRRFRTSDDVVTPIPDGRPEEEGVERMAVKPETLLEDPHQRPRWSGADWSHHVAVGTTVGLAALLPTALMANYLQPHRDPEEMHILLKTIRGHGWDYLVPIFLSAAVLAPIKEELIFRVILQGSLADHVGKLAIPLMSLVFAALHGPSDAVLIVPLALILGTLYEYRRSYVEVVAAHAAFNAANLFAAVNQ